MRKIINPCGFHCIKVNHLGVKFYVDVLFDVDSNNEYYAKIRLDLNDLSTTKPNECVNLHEYTISNNDLIMMKKDIGLGDPAYNKQGNIDWDATSDKWKLFYIDEHLRHKSTVTIRLATTGEIKLPNGRTYEFGGYTLSGVPRIYQDIAIPIWNSNSDSVCNMECNCPWKSECKFRGDICITGLPTSLMRMANLKTGMVDDVVRYSRKQTSITRVSLTSWR